MNEEQNTRVVQDAYAAFKRGDISAVLNAMSDDIPSLEGSVCILNHPRILFFVHRFASPSGSQYTPDSQHNVYNIRLRHVETTEFRRTAVSRTEGDIFS